MNAAGTGPESGARTGVPKVRMAMHLIVNSQGGGSGRITLTEMRENVQLTVEVDRALSPLSLQLTLAEAAKLSELLRHIRKRVNERRDRP